jgi:hypothetical protein
VPATIYCCYRSKMRCFPRGSGEDWACVQCFGLTQAFLAHRQQHFIFKHNLYKLREERDMKPSTFGELVSSTLYEKRYGRHTLSNTMAVGNGKEASLLRSHMTRSFNIRMSLFKDQVFFVEMLVRQTCAPLPALPAKQPDMKMFAGKDACHATCESGRQCS